jgi:hypothetical protein
MSFNVYGNTTPATINGNDSDDYALGTVVQITEAATITKARQYFSNPLPSGPVVWRVSDLSTHDILVSHTFTSPTSGWVEQDLASPLVIAGARNVVVWSGTPDGYVFTNGFFTSAATVSGPLTAPKSADDPEGIGNGRFGGSAGSYPAGTSGATAYFVDLVVELAPNEGATSFDAYFTLAGVGDAPAAIIPSGIAAFGLTFVLAGVGVAPAPPPPPVRGGWDSLGNIYRSNAEEARRQATEVITECPVHLYPLEEGKREGVLHCKFGGELWDRYGKPIYW